MVKYVDWKILFVYDEFMMVVNHVVDNKLF